MRSDAFIVCGLNRKVAHMLKTVLKELDVEPVTKIQIKGWRMHLMKLNFWRAGEVNSFLQVLAGFLTNYSFACVERTPPPKKKKHLQMNKQFFSLFVDVKPKLAIFCQVI